MGRRIAICCLCGALTWHCGASGDFKDELKFCAPCYIDAAGEGNLPEIEGYLGDGMAIDAVDESGHGALLLASGNGRLEVVKRLLAAGANPSLADKEGRTPLMAAIAGKHREITKLLLASGAEPRDSDAEGRSPLRYALEAGEAWAVDALLTQGGDFKVPANDGISPLQLIYETRDPRLISRAFQAQVGALHWDALARAWFFHALRNENRELLQIMLRKFEGAPTAGEGCQSLLAYAIAKNDLRTVRLLLECGADPNVRLARPAEKGFKALINDPRLEEYLATESGLTPLMVAAGTGKLEIVELLLQFGAKRGAVTEKHKIAALLFAAWRSDVETMLVLLGRNPRPEQHSTWVEISLSQQRVGFYKAGQLYMESSVSTGQPGFETPTGLFVVTDKQRSRFSSLYKVEMPFFMRLSCSELGMHAGVVPGYPASHGCIRLPAANAVRLYRELEIGTLVKITY